MNGHGSAAAEPDLWPSGPARAALISGDVVGVRGERASSSESSIKASSPPSSPLSPDAAALYGGRAPPSHSSASPQASAAVTKMSEMEVDEDVRDDDDFVDAREAVKNGGGSSSCGEDHETQKLIGEKHRNNNFVNNTYLAKRDAVSKLGSKSTNQTGPRRVKAEHHRPRENSRSGESKRLSIGSSRRAGSGGGGSSRGSGQSTPQVHNQHEYENIVEEVEGLRMENNDHEQRIRDLEQTVKANQSKIADLELRCLHEEAEKRFWSRKHEEVHAEYLKTDKQLRLLQADDPDSKVGSQREWEAKLGSVVSELDTFRKAYASAQEVRYQLSEEIKAYQQQVAALKRDIASSTRMQAQVADDEFREKMFSLANDLQNWVINRFRKVEIELNREKLSDNVKGELIAFTPSYKIAASVSKFDIISAIISGVLVYDVFKAYYFGMEDERVDIFQRMDSYLNMMLPDSQVNRLRSAKLALIKDCKAVFVQEHTRKLSEQVETRISSLLSSITGVPNSQLRDAALHNIVRSAVKIAQLLRVQRAQFSVEVPSTDPALPAAYDPTIMEDVKARDDVDLKNRPILAVTFPALFKNGDENGENLTTRAVISKAKVLCQSD